MLGRVVASSAVLITLAGCAEARSATAKGGIPSRAFSKAILVADSSPADVAHVVCEKDAVRLENPDVRAQRDGVHFLIENQATPGVSISTTIRGRTAPRRGSS
jgi:hypothetical protein